MPRFSICIPTRERHATLPFSIETVLRQTFRDFELVVQDNCSSEETARIVRGIDDSRIIYSRSNERLSMHANWEQALLQTSGDYVVFLGDDDGLQPRCLETAARIVENRRVDLLAWLAHTYYWPNVPDQRRRNYLTLDLRSATSWAEHFAPERAALDRRGLHTEVPPGVFCLDSHRLLHNWLAHTGARVYVPTYHNLVSRRLIDRVRTWTEGTYFFNPLPDFGTLIANLYAADEVLFYSAPLSMTGHAGGSSGGTHGDLESWTRTLQRFIAEAGVKPRDLLPSVFEEFLWAPALLAGCFEQVKRRLFPNHPRLTVDWERFLRDAAAQVDGEPEAVRPACREWIRSSASRIGVDPESIEFPPVEPWQRRVGTQLDPLGRIQFQFLDGDAFGLRTVADAVNVAEQFRPLTLYETHIPGALRAEVAAGAWRNPVELPRRAAAVARRLGAGATTRGLRAFQRSFGANRIWGRKARQSEWVG